MISDLMIWKGSIYIIYLVTEKHSQTHANVRRKVLAIRKRVGYERGRIYLIRPYKLSNETARKRVSVLLMTIHEFISLSLTFQNITSRLLVCGSENYLGL